MSPPAWVAFVVAGAAGACLRYEIGERVRRRTDGVFPWGTLLINVSGSLLFGFLTGLSLYHAFPDTPLLVLGTGFCGAYTTFSAFTFETVQLLGDGALGPAFRNAAGTLVTCASAAAAGLGLGALLRP